MIRNISVGIDIGTHSTRVVVAEYSKDDTVPTIIGSGHAESKGIHHGYVVNMVETVKSLKKAITEAEKASGIKIKRAFVSIGGISLSSEIGIGSAIISKADGEVTNFDIAKAFTDSEEGLEIMNRKVLHMIPVAYKLDGKEIHGKPEGMRGVKLETKCLFVTCLTQHLDDLVMAVTEAGIDVIDVVASPIAVANVTLTDRQKSAGCVLADIGAETVSIGVFENGMMVSLRVFPIGGVNITNDIALGLKIPLDEAEGVKIGSILGNYPKKKLDEVIEARLSDIFELIDSHLKKIKRSELLPAGIIIIGGGGNIPLIEEMAKDYLRLPARIGSPLPFLSAKNKPRDFSWYSACGLCMMNKEGYTEGSSISEVTKEIKKFFGSIGRQLLP